MKLQLLILLISSTFTLVNAQNSYINLYEGAIPNAKPSENLEKTTPRPGKTQFTTDISVPTIARFDPADNVKNGTTVIIYPGGGYSGTADEHEGTQVAQKLNQMGITAFVVRYRMPSSRTMIDPSIGSLQDAQQAIRYVRQNADKWKLDKNRIGIMGFSAGGHLAATVGTHFQTKADPSVNDTFSVRPDFMILAYPVISFKTELTHMGSRNNLLGKEPSVEKIHAFSNEEHVTLETPPTFIVHAGDDGAVKVDNSLEFYKACIKNNVSVEMHLYPKGGHGFGMNNKTTTDKWMDRLANWFVSQKIL